MKRTINEIYELIEQKKENAERDRERTLQEIRNIKDYDGNILKNERIKGEVDAYVDVLILIETSGVLERSK